MGKKIRLLVFLQGTTIMHASAIGRMRAERVEQVRRGEDPALREYGLYVPVDDAAAKLRRWHEQGAKIAYLSSHRDPDDIALDASVLRRFGFPPGRVLARQGAESYGDVAGRELPDILIEDNCESIGASEITYPQIRADLRARIRSIIVPEFGGLAHLPDAVSELISFAEREH